MRQHIGLPATRRAFLLSLGIILCAAAAGCGGQQATAPQAPKRYALKGTVLSVDRAQERLVVDHEAIPDFMAAMAMPYPVADPKLLDVAGPGDQITADVVVEDRSAHLENIVVVKKAEPKPGGSLREGVPGQRSPNREFARRQSGQGIGAAGDPASAAPAVS